jgi:hypothetical protein
MAGGETENAERREDASTPTLPIGPGNVSQTLRRTEWKRLLQRVPRTLTKYIAEKQAE